MNIARTLLPLALAAAPTMAQEDPLKSAACGEALASLQAARGARAQEATVEALRSAAAAACLGSATVPTRPGRIAREPLVVPPPQVEVPARAAPPLPAPAPPPPPVAIQRPPVPTHCDVGGCWTSDGTHLKLVPPNFPGPNGLCTQQAGLVYCP